MEGLGSGGSLMSGNVTRYVEFVSGRFVALQDDALKASDDDGATWRTLPTPVGCIAPSIGLLSHDLTLLLVHFAGRVCVSRDRGDTWSLLTIATAFSTNGVYAQGAFNVWNGATRYRSLDGLTWTSATGTPSDASIGPVVYTPAGTFVAFKGGWQADYQYQRVYRSADGITWTALAANAYPHSHYVTHLTSAQLRASAVCPAP